MTILKAIGWLKGIAEKGDSGEPKFDGPMADEEEKAFMGRCISHMKGKGKSQEQSVAICVNMWSKKE